MKKNGLVVCCVLLISFRITSYSQGYFKEGLRLYLDGKDKNSMEASIEQFSKAISMEQETAKSYMYRGAAKIQLNRYGEALMDIKHSIQLDSNNYKAYFYYGRAYFLQGFYKTAIKWYDIAISKNKTDADVYDDRAMAKGKEGDYKGAILDENEAIKINPEVGDYYSNRGFAKLESNQLDEAIKDFDIALSKGNFPMAYANKGMALSKQGKHREAISNYTIAMEKLPKAKDIPYFRGLEYKAIGMDKEYCLDLQKSSQLGYLPAKEELKKNCN